MLPRDGVLLVLLSSAWFSATALMIKALGTAVPVVWVVFVRNAVSIGPVLFLMLRRGLPLRAENPGGLVLRGVWGVAAMLTGFWALPRLPLANATLLAHAAPVYAAMLGAAFLGERLERGAPAFLALAFLGLYLAVPPLSGAAALPTAAAFASGLFSGLAFTALRVAAGQEPPLRIVLYYACIGAGMFLLPVLFSGFLPSPRQALLLFCGGASSTIGQILLTMGFGRVPVARGSLGTLFVVVLNIAGGWAFWGESPNLGTWVGCVLIALGILGLTKGFRKRLLVSLPG